MRGTGRPLSGSAFLAGLLLSGAAVTPGAAPAAMPPLLEAPVSGRPDQHESGPAVPAVAASVPAPPAPVEASLPDDPAVAATGTGPGETDIVVMARSHPAPGDPLQAVNTKSFEITQSVDRAFVGPVALAYKRNLPGSIRSGLRNFLGNLREPVVFLNFLVQINPGKAAETLGRFGINSTIGVAGLFDIAKRHPFRLPRRPNGFGDSMGYYGVKPGAYMYLPLIGPTTTRDLAGLILDRLVLPVAVGMPFNQLAYSIPSTTIMALDHRAEFDEQLHELHDGPADPYITTRDFYLRQRQAEIDDLHGRHPRPGETGSELSKPVDGDDMPAQSL
jgi:phospholipid-binding lipoprotein MlaA